MRVWMWDCPAANVRLPKTHMYKHATFHTPIYRKPTPTPWHSEMYKKSPQPNRKLPQRGRWVSCLGNHVAPDLRTALLFQNVEIKGILHIDYRRRLSLVALRLCTTSNTALNLVEIWIFSSAIATKLLRRGQRLLAFMQCPCVLQIECKHWNLNILRVKLGYTCSQRHHPLGMISCQLARDRLSLLCTYI